jgi:hypothetical protein
MKNKIMAGVTSGLVMFGMTIIANANTYIGTYEVSYTYNDVYDTGGLNRPIGPILYNGQNSAPVKVLLAPGDYFTTFVTGRITGNDFTDYGYQAAYNAYVPLLNPGSVPPATGFNGGNTDPTHNNPNDGWWYMIAGWVGTSESDTNGSLFGGGIFSINKGQSLWLYWNDPYIYDNLGGVTVEVWQTASAGPVPEPATMLLFGAGLIGLASVRRKKTA